MLAALLAGCCALAGCASGKVPAQMSTPAAIEETEPLPADMKPLTVEQEENVAGVE